MERLVKGWWKKQWEYKWGVLNLKCYWGSYDTGSYLTCIWLGLLLHLILNISWFLVTIFYNSEEKKTILIFPFDHFHNYYLYSTLTFGLFKTAFSLNFQRYFYSTFQLRTVSKVLLLLNFPLLDNLKNAAFTQLSTSGCYKIDYLDGTLTFLQLTPNSINFHFK
jgi:hypothetical protein